MTSRSEEYYELYLQLGTYSAVARELNVDESSVRESLQRREAREKADPALRRGMDKLGMETPPSGGWIKTTKPDDDGNLYSYYVRGTPAAVASAQARIDGMADVFRSVPAVKLERLSSAPKGTAGLVGFIPMNDVHAGAYAWSAETGYGDWDLDIAVTRLKRWAGDLIAKMPTCAECILFFNGDMLHANDGKGMTPHSGHILDTDTRHAKVIDATTSAMIVVADMAAQKHGHIRVVIKRGNHDPEAYLALLQGMKWRYIDQKNVTVEEDPSPYWHYQFGKVFLFGHHGDRVQTKDLILKVSRDHRDEYGRSTFCYGWTAHLHKNDRDTIHGVKVERASCITEPDAHGAAWGNSAEMVAVIYHPDRGEVERYTRRNW